MKRFVSVIMLRPKAVLPLLLLLLLPLNASAQAFDGIEPNSLVGEFLRVRITGADEYDLTAEVI